MPALSDVEVSPHANRLHEAITQAQTRPAKLITGNSPKKKATASPVMVTENLYKRAVAHAKKSPTGYTNVTDVLHRRRKTCLGCICPSLTPLS
ncbi:hypothetical protein GJ744_009896 [Endocarpon pusillum]|uniref:Uncharacterized protein n=1 Tax=Endocarpon pusillum TaxID=364733 RepID=A0A8H7E2D6_9EURO|nr:hypothetical protein GJ744_009896 [Endocarpon pusillum]